MAATVNLRDTLEGMVKKVLPHLDSIALDLVVDLLITEGVMKVVDVRHITIEILKQTLDTIDATDLYVHFQNNYGSSAGLMAGSCSNVQSTARMTQNAATTSRSSLGVLQEDRTGVRSILNFMPTYDRDSHVMTTAIDAKQRPRSRSRTQMVSNIVEDCKKHVPNLERSMFKLVADDLCAKYPLSFKDTIPVSEIGSESLAKQLADKFDNDKRPDKAKGKNKDPPASAFGCISYDPPMPDEESMVSQERTRMALVEMFKRAKKDWVWREIRKKMEETFYLQRKDINSHSTLNRPHATAEPPQKRRKQATEQAATEDEEVIDNPDAEETNIVPQLLERWPFLFTLRGMNQHFTKLTGLDMKDLWESYVRERGSNLVEFLATKSEALAKERRIMIGAENAGRGWTKHAALLRMLNMHFKEDWKTLVIFTEQTTSFSEVADTAVFPNDFPVIVAAGEKMYQTDKFYVCVDQQPVAQVKNISEAIIMLFELYFVYHKFEYYADTNVNFLYFLQRVVASLMPVSGRKASSAAKHKAASDKVNRFNNKFVEYVQLLDAEANVEN